MYYDDGYYLSPEDERALRLSIAVYTQYTQRRILAIEQKAHRLLVKKLSEKNLECEPTEKEIADFTAAKSEEISAEAELEEEEGRFAAGLSKPRLSDYIQEDQS